VTSQDSREPRHVDRSGQSAPDAIIGTFRALTLGGIDDGKRTPIGRLMLDAGPIVITALVSPLRRERAMAPRIPACDPEAQSLSR
jgi:hypothetical protein